MSGYKESAGPRMVLAEATPTTEVGAVVATGDPSATFTGSPYLGNFMYPNHESTSS